MLELLFDVLAFALKAGLVFATVAAIAVVIAGLSGRRSAEPVGRLRLRRLDKRLARLGKEIARAGLGAKAAKQARKAEAKADKAEAKAAAPDTPRPRVFVLDFEGDLQAARVKQLREEVSAIVGGAREGDEVLLRLNSPGGSVTGYGLAASQLARLSERKIPLTVAVDQVAASGGYMMAVVADRILAAPFAMIGSIGVVATLPNLRRFLRKHDVDVEQLTAGRHKRTLSVLGENTDEGRAHFQADLEAIHAQFKEHVARYRPQLDVEQVADGGHWTAERAVRLGLVDELLTSDDWLLARADGADLIEVAWEPPKTVRRRLGLAVEDAAVRVGERLWGRLTRSPLA